MDAIAHFKQAAKAFQTDELYLRYMQAKQDNDADEALQKNIGEFNLLRLDLNNEMDKAERDQDRIEELNARISELYSAVMDNPNMTAYSQAKHQVEHFISYVNEVLNAALAGEDPLAVCPSAGDCSGGCSGCAGC